MAVALPPDSLISRSTVLIVEAGELGFGGKGDVVAALDVVLAATTTEIVSLLGQVLIGQNIKYQSIHC